MASRSWKKIILGLIFLILSILYTILFFNKASFGETMTFNIAHLKSLSNVLVSPINFDFWNHTGSQMNLFSPWLTILTGWMFVQFNVIYGFSVYLTIVTFLTLVSAYFFMNKFHKDTFEALLFAIGYTFSLNRLLLVFSNQRLENYLVLIFLPMVYFGAYQFFTNHAWKTLVWGEALIVWTSPYVAIAVAATLVVAFVLMPFSRLSHSWNYVKKTSLNVLKVISMGVITTIGFIGPLVMKQLNSKWQQDPIKNFDYLDWFTKLQLSRMQWYLMIAISVLLLLLILMIFLQSSFAYKIIIFEMIPIACLLILQPKISNVDISRLIFAFQSIFDFFFIMVLCRMIMLVFQESPAILKLVILLISIGGLGYVNYSQVSTSPKRSLEMADSVDYKKFVVNYHDVAQKNNNKFLINGKQEKVSYYTKGSDYWIQYINPQTTTIDIPIQYSPNYQIQINNESVSAKKTKQNTVQLKTNPGKSIIEIHSRYDWWGLGFLLVNLFGFMLLIYFSLQNIPLKNKKNPENS
ncbi:hypothetical protein ABB45_08605 [Companilactobacillus farciminis]|nr:hypothetical protein ABB45_08605 [Companilactobacillus farciminis]GAQ00526.1 hypothetical protein NBRC111452_323 [Companilactobacillus farciminis]